MLKKILLALMFVIAAITGVTYAEDDMKTVASKAYVDTQIETKQLKIPAAGQPNVDAGETVMTYTATGNGQIGERGLYSDISSYDASTDGDKLITASALNATFTNLPTTPTTKLECANQADGCTLWTIVDQTAYARGLPAEYTRLEYIQSTGTQYIDPNIVITPTNISTFKTEAVISNVTRESGSISGHSSTKGVLWYGLTALSPYDFYYSTGKREYDMRVQSNFQFYKFVIDAPDKSYNVYTESNELVASKTNITYQADNTFNFYLFIYKLGVSGKPQKIKYAKFWQNGTIVRDMIPAKNSSGVIGMYDTVSGTFFTNAGGNDNFVAGPVAN